MGFSDKYYTDFSKFALQSQPLKKDNKSIQYNEWINNSNIVERMNLQILKNTLRVNKLPIHGNKEVVIKRIHNYYTQIKSVITIQRIFRGFLVRETEKLRGPAAKNTFICTNETEFYTMNPLNELPRKYLFSYRDSNGFVYGFNIFVLMDMFKRNRRLVNPYNREDMPFDTLISLFSIYKKTRILYPTNSDYIFI
jgi:hypothetical protein